MDDADGLVGPPETDVLGAVGRYLEQNIGALARHQVALTCDLARVLTRLYCRKCDARLVCNTCGAYYRNCTGPCACGDVAACPDCDLAVAEVRDRDGAVVGMLRGVCSEAPRPAEGARAKEVLP
ncbi:hypothetical protein [Nannocystis bainbridge]|uniref:Uncharacterized protein n=1 Tax=Nannocystis bainbridge TaxID=2995303 RepID=A0ABT5E0U6_9BACT|nr:hypothetical protein [Nannocystis bainbridge]MDC0719421.1 hypothetical protein [Nannocystis bainbridge]